VPTEGKVTVTKVAIATVVLDTCTLLGTTVQRAIRNVGRETTKGREPIAVAGAIKAGASTTKTLGHQTNAATVQPVVVVAAMLTLATRVRTTSIGTVIAALAIAPWGSGGMQTRVPSSAPLVL
jgi:hypothetical protein